MGLITNYQLNELIIGTLTFIFFFSIYRFFQKSDSVFIVELLYMAIAFLITYLSMLVVYNYVNLYKI